jgi:catechol 2,3-dioxygenase-like lactoylglutathione lyase family enzyme
MTIRLDHTIVPVTDKHRGARLLADLLGLRIGAPAGPFLPVQINDELTLDFDDRHGGRPGHYAFLVDDATFDAALASAARQDLRIQHSGERAAYIFDPDGIGYEFFTAVP